MTNRNITLISLSAAAFLLAVPCRAEMKVSPVADVSLMGGKYYLDSKESAFNFRMDAFVSPAIKLGEDQDLIPVYSGNYSGTQDIQELAGGGVLTRRRQAHTLSLKYVLTREFNKYKPRFSYSKALVSETRDEKWGDGLFDYGSLSFGFEAEQERPHGTYTESYDYYSVKYPNYSTLLSQSQSVFNDTDTFNQLSTNAGENPLDNIGHRFAFTYTWFPEPLTLQAGYDLTYRSYADQAVAANPSVGQSPFKSDTRADISQNLTFRVSRATRYLQFGCGAHFSYLTSNQASYDSTNQKYMKDYYGYYELGVAPSLTVRAKNGAQLGLSLDWRRQYYTGRPAQNSAGVYGGAKIRQDHWLSALYARYPVGKRFYGRLSYNYQVSSSNMRYEANYRYNYRASTALLGVEWEF